MLTPHKIILFFTLVIAFTLSAHATQYYWNGTGDVRVLSSWGTNLNGTGTPPPSFSTNNQEFIFQNSQTTTLAAAWSVTGIGSIVTIQNGGTLNGAGYNNTLTLNVQNGGSYSTGSGSSNLSLSSTFALNSTFTMTSVGTGNPWSLNFGNLILADPGSKNTNNFTIQKDLTLSGGGTVNPLSSADTTWTIGGDLNVSSGTTWAYVRTTFTEIYNITGGLTNSGTMSRSATTGTATINFNGSNASNANVTWGTLSGKINSSIGSGRTVTFTDSFNTSGGDVSISGKLLVSSGQSITTGAGTFTVNNGGTLAGTGTVNSLVTFASGSTHSVGTSSTPGIQTLAGGASYTGSAVKWDLIANKDNGTGTRGTDFDGINITGGTFNVTSSTIDLVFNGSGSTVNFADTFWQQGRSWTIDSSTVTRVGSFTIGTISTDSLGHSYSSYGSFSLSPTGNDVTLNWQYIPVPEPEAIGLVLLGIGWLIVRRKNRKY